MEPDRYRDGRGAKLEDSAGIRLGVLFLAMLLASPCWAAPTDRSISGAVGENIYRNGMLSSGEPLFGERAPGTGVSGAAAACMNCHRRSGLGEVEGPAWVPPITGRYLYRPRRQDDHGGDARGALLSMAEPAARSALSRQADRDAYTDTTLARAIREGVAADGRRLDYLMPRFRLGDTDLASLIAYLKQLSKWPSPGVGEATLQFATIVTPDADPIRRSAMLDVLDHFFGKENVFSGGQAPPAQHARRFIATAHRWQLHVWELTGPPEAWQAELEERLRREPVFAIVSGIGGRSWEPVHRFCEQAGMPCLFPNIDLPMVAEQDFYNIYLSKGVLLEAHLIAQRLRFPAAGDKALPAGWRLVQVYRRGDIGEEAAAELRVALASIAVPAVDRVLDPATDSSAPRELLSGIRPADVLVLWLRPIDIGSLPAQPPAATAAFVSGIMGGLERAPLTGYWRDLARITYPFELPDRRRVSMNYPLGWMRFKGIPVVDERTQTDTYVACAVAADAVRMMGEDLVRDHLVETLETHLSMHLVNGYYPRLGLASGQRFASKGGFLARFADPEGPRLVADGDWSVP